MKKDEKSKIKEIEGKIDRHYCCCRLATRKDSAESERECRLATRKDSAESERECATNETRHHRNFCCDLWALVFKV